MTFGQVTIDPALPLNVHEQVERFVMAELGLPYAQAHVVATAAERWFVTARLKVDWQAWERWIDGELSAIERGPRANPPPDPHVDIEAAIGHHRARDANVEVVPDQYTASLPGLSTWFNVKVDGQLLKDKNGWLRRFRSGATAAAAGRKFASERGQATEDGVRELVARYVTPERARAAVAAALIGLVGHVGQAQGPDFEAAIEHTVHNIADIASVSAGKAREIVNAAVRPLTRARTGDAPYTEVAGLQVVVEQPKGSVRRWEGGQTVYPADYGYARRVGSAEGEQEWLDVIVGPHLGSRDVWVIDSVNAATGKFDEHKLVLGARNAREALGYFRGIYAPGFRRVGAVTHLSADSYEFKDWVARGDKARPMQELAA